MTNSRTDDQINEFKAQAAGSLRKRIREMGITQQAAADICDMNRSDLNGALNGKLAGHSLQKLLKAALALGMTVSITLGA